MRDHWAEANAEAWRAMEEAVQAGKIRAIGVSNFRRHHLDALLETAETKLIFRQKGSAFWQILYFIGWFETYNFS